MAQSNAQSDKEGTAVIVDGKVVAWFAEFDDEAADWCSYNHFGKWIAWRATAPEIVPLTEVEYDRIMEQAKELSKLFKEE